MLCLLTLPCKHKMQGIFKCKGFFIHSHHPLHKLWSFPLRISSVNVTKSQFPADLVTFTAEILDGKFHFLCSDFASLNPFPWKSSSPSIEPTFRKKVLSKSMYMKKSCRFKMCKFSFIFSSKLPRTLHLTGSNYFKSTLTFLIMILSF